MEIKTKYNIGDRVWVVYEDRGEVSVYDTWINSIEYDKEGLTYYTREANDYPEEAMLLYEEKDKLLEKIEQVMNEIHKRESEGK